MASKKRDPETTGRIDLPWGPSAHCPCGSGEPYAACCRQPTGEVYKRFAWPIPVGDVTSFRHEGCYLGATANCSRQISREHFVSQSVLRLINEKHVKITGAPWLSAGKSQALSIDNLAANVLCTRHNSALSPLDDVAGGFFQAVRWIFDDQLKRKSLSRRNAWFLFSGEMLELWMLKVALGLFHARIVAKDGKPFRDRHVLSSSLIGAFEGKPLAPTCRLSVHRELAEGDGLRDEINCTPMVDDAAERMIGLRVQFMGVPLLQMIDPNVHYGPAVLSAQITRPTYLIFKGRVRRHTVVLTWPSTGPTKEAVQFSERPR